MDFQSKITAPRSDQSITFFRFSIKTQDKSWAKREQRADKKAKQSRAEQSRARRHPIRYYFLSGRVDLTFLPGSYLPLGEQQQQQQQQQQQIDLFTTKSDTGGALTNNKRRRNTCTYLYWETENHFFHPEVPIKLAILPSCYMGLDDPAVKGRPGWLAGWPPQRRFELILLWN